MDVAPAAPADTVDAELDRLISRRASQDRRRPELVSQLSSRSLLQGVSSYVLHLPRFPDFVA